MDLIKLRDQSLHCTFYYQLAISQESGMEIEKKCTRTKLQEHIKKSFRVWRLGRTRNVKTCISLCCSNKMCDLALLSNTRCYGVSCSHHELCRNIMNTFRIKRHEIFKRSSPESDGRFLELV